MRTRPTELNFQFFITLYTVQRFFYCSREFHFYFASSTACDTKKPDNSLQYLRRWNNTSHAIVFFELQVAIKDYLKRVFIDQDILEVSLEISFQPCMFKAGSLLYFFEVYLRLLFRHRVFGRKIPFMHFSKHPRELIQRSHKLSVTNVHLCKEITAGRIQRNSHRTRLPICNYEKLPHFEHHEITMTLYSYSFYKNNVRMFLIKIGGIVLQTL